MSKSIVNDPEITDDSIESKMVDELVDDFDAQLPSDIDELVCDGEIHEIPLITGQLILVKDLHLYKEAVLEFLNLLSTRFSKLVDGFLFKQYITIRFEQTYGYIDERQSTNMHISIFLKITNGNFYTRVFNKFYEN